jgi:predicted acylesterase/phospholipase RssA
MSVLDRLTFPGPKRLLALDGGGIRGAITLGFLEQMERLLRARHKREDLKLCDYFDLIGGTSTGAIIASGLAIGMTASEIKRMYLELGGKVFSANRWWRKLRALFDPEQLRLELQKVFGDRTLGDPSIHTGLCIIAKRADTGSTWPLLNHPAGKYYPHNKDILLRRAIRASTAAPVYFEPEQIDIGRGEVGAFVDGGVSMANNPALQLFLVATLQGFPFHWPIGEDQLLLVSIGTGVCQRHEAIEVVTDSRLWDWARGVPSMLMEDASWQNQLLLQYLSRTKTPWMIDREVGDLSTDLLTPEPALSYLRYNVWLDENGLNGLGLTSFVTKLDSLREMSAGENRNDLALIGERAAERQVRDDHFPSTFDLP